MVILSIILVLAAKLSFDNNIFCNSFTDILIEDSTSNTVFHVDKLFGLLVQTTDFRKLHNINTLNAIDHISFEFLEITLQGSCYNKL